MTRSVIALLLLTLASGVPARGQGGTPQARPNIVLILADDLGYSDVGSYGAEIRTPNLDRLAAGGLRFNQFYNATRCSPTRASLLTGLYPHQAGMGHMPDAYAARVRGAFDSPAYTVHLAHHTPTIAEVLRGAGYATFLSGKWHLGYDRPNWPIDRGFDRSFAVTEGALNYYGHGIQHTGQVTDPPMVEDDRPYRPGSDFFATDDFTDRAVGYIRERDTSRPFFLYLSYSAPHWPLHAPASDIARYRGMYAAGWDRVREARYRRLVEAGLIRPEWKLAPRAEQVPAWESVPAEEQARWEREMEIYAAQTERMDAGIGRVLRALQEAGIEDNTLVIFLSDNGGAAEDPNRSLPGSTLGERDSYEGYGVRGAHVSSAPFRLTKKFIHEGGISTPVIVHWPAAIGAGGEVRHQVAHIVDLMPTLVEAAGANFPDEWKGRRTVGLEGISFLPALRGEPVRERRLFWEHEGNRAVRDGHWKLVSRFSASWELYDMRADRTELNDLAARHPEQVDRLRKLYEAWAARVGAGPWELVPPPGGGE